MTTANKRSCKRLTIFEGPDGGGKTRLARAFANQTNALYRHAGPYPQIIDGAALANVYNQLMLPAVEGYTDVVMDRSWLSEAIYANVFRNGEDRLGLPVLRMLERVAMRAETVLVLCLPPFQECANTFARRPEEYLTTEEQLKDIYDAYRYLHYNDKLTALPTITYDWTVAVANGKTVDDTAEKLLSRDNLPSLSYPHVAETPSAGNLVAPFVLVGDEFGPVKNGDPPTQYPFVSYSRSGCSVWITEQLARSQIKESKLLWLNADFGAEAISNIIALHRRRVIFCLGNKAHDLIKSFAWVGEPPEIVKVKHPQWAKRFAYNEPYELMTEIRKRR